MKNGILISLVCYILSVVISLLDIIKRTSLVWILLGIICFIYGERYEGLSLIGMVFVVNILSWGIGRGVKKYIKNIKERRGAYSEK